MKKILAFLLGLILTLGVLVLSLDIPFSESEPTGSPTTAPATVPVHPTPSGSPTIPPVIRLPMSAIVLTEQTELSKDENGQVYFSYTYPNVRLFLQNESINESVMLDLLNRIDATRSNADSVRLNAADLGDAVSFYQVHYAPQRIDGGILSLSATMTSFSGGAHPSSVCSGITYDLLTGTYLTLNDILTDNCSADVLCRLVVDALEQIRTDGMLYSDYAVSVEDRFSGDFLSDEGWYLSGKGLCFSFEPYEIGPYSSGIITATIPYGQLPGYLEDAWFPPEQITAPGNLIIDDLKDIDLDPELNLVEVALDPDAPAVIIQADGLLYQITIQTRYPQPTVLFAADQLTPGTAIILRCDSRNLQISCVSNEETITQPIEPT